MKKSMRNGESCAFSLAEALITLLIVCLITLASIPILTKKRRNMEAGHRGTWICSRNSAGEYVYWDKSHAIGQKDDPDTWAKTGTDSCTFTPPAGADRFSLTVIGGGGGGGDARSTNLSMARAVGPGGGSFAPSEDGLYFVEVVGGGGGKGDIAQSNEYNGAASGAGGSGAAIYGYFYLLNGTSYSFYAGKKGDMGESHYHSGYDRGSNSRTPGQTGGASFFKANSGGTDTVTFLGVGGGGGGDSTSYNADNHAVGGTGGGGGTVLNNDYLGKSESVVALNGNRGANGAARNWNNPGRNAIGGMSVAKTPYYGRGTDGDVFYGRRYTYTDGQPGYVEVSLIERYHGEGGKSAVPASYYLPKIEGVIVATVGTPADSSTRGSNTVAVNKRAGVIGRTFIGYGADAGANSKYISEPEMGMHSQFTMKGGGAASPKCSDAKYVPAGWGNVEVPYVKCKSVKCVIKMGDNTDSEATIVARVNNILNANISSGGARIVPTGFGNVRYNGSTITAPLGIIDGSGEVTKIEPFSKALTLSNARTYLSSTLRILDYVDRYNIMSNESSVSQHFFKWNNGDKYEQKEEDGEFYSYKNYKDVYNNYYCYRDANITYMKICADEEYGTETTQGYHSAQWVPAMCNAEQKGGNGTSFGAGGGGGYATLTPNVASRGGKGGPGAVIIEW